MSATPVPIDGTPFAAPAQGGIDCSLCYRRCHLEEGQAGPCGYRVVKDGRLVRPRHGELSAATRAINGFGVDPFLTYKPGLTSLFYGGMQCTSACTFCMSTNIVHNPETVPLALKPDQTAPAGSLWYAMRAFMHPVDAVENAVAMGAGAVTFGINEPTLSWEWTAETARLAKARGLDVLVETNGFTTPEAIRDLAPLVDAVDVGIKGSADPEFYARRMRSEGAVPAVLDAVRIWRDEGVHVIVGDLIATPAMQADSVFEESAKRLYDHLAEVVGPITDVLTTPIMSPGPKTGPARSMTRTAVEGEQYQERQDRALELAHEAGLTYAHTKLESSQSIECHNCSSLLLHFAERCTAGWLENGVPGNPKAGCVMAEHFCPWWSVQTYVTEDSRCLRCRTPVPIVPMRYDQLERSEEAVSQGAKAISSLGARHLLKGMR